MAESVRLRRVEKMRARLTRPPAEAGEMINAVCVCGECEKCTGRAWHMRIRGVAASTVWAAVELAEAYADHEKYGSVYADILRMMPRSSLDPSRCFRLGGR